ncbi:hypothetical protein HK100_001619 [Physocladia obscura]|uniref:Uncharacterized protein n=1 Tax=Physocladia obscura TaxID=109957 RepID=A0AAD5SYJ8_9FUNG|nr:hypothetical protein HK100_001619 [Physocladia obscura]
MRREGNTFSSSRHRPISTNSSLRYKAPDTTTTNYFILPADMTHQQAIERAHLSQLAKSLVNRMDHPQYIPNNNSWAIQQSRDLAALGFGNGRTCASLNRPETAHLKEVAEDSWRQVRTGREENIYVNYNAAAKALKRHVYNMEAKQGIHSHRREHEEFDIADFHGEERAHMRSWLKSRFFE